MRLLSQSIVVGSSEGNFVVSSAPLDQISIFSVRRIFFFFFLLWLLLRTEAELFVTHYFQSEEHFRIRLFTEVQQLVRCILVTLS